MFLKNYLSEPDQVIDLKNSNTESDKYAQA